LLAFNGSHIAFVCVISVIALFTVIKGLNIVREKRKRRELRIKNYLFVFFASFAPQGHLSLRSGTFFADGAFLLFLEYPARLRRGGLFVAIQTSTCISRVAIVMFVTKRR